MNDEWEEVPAEDLWEDGELTLRQVMLKLYSKVCVNGYWKVVRRREFKPINKHKTSTTVL